jgi:hypothetical protein
MRGGKNDEMDTIGFSGFFDFWGICMGWYCYHQIGMGSKH